MLGKVVSCFCLLSLILLSGCYASDSSQGDAAVEANIRYLSSNDTVTDHRHIVMQGETSFRGGPVSVNWYNSLSGLSGQGVSWSESDCNGLFGCAVPPILFEVDVLLEYGENPIRVDVSGGGLIASDSILITRIDDIQAPTIYQTFPANNATLVDPGSTITVIFDNEEIDAATLTPDTIKIYDQNGIALGGAYEVYTILKTVESSNLPGLYCGPGSSIAALGGHVYGLICDEKMALRFTPDVPLLQNTSIVNGETQVLSGYTYTIFVSGTVADLAGNALTNDAFFKFTTGYIVN